jgi:Holliday junction resolvasome RuvABC DNA-binding subunit
VGKRLAGRIVLELKEKVDAAGSTATSEGGGEAEVVAALEALGYSSREGREAARAAVAALSPDASLEERVKEALQSLRQ